MRSSSLVTAPTLSVLASGWMISTASVASASSSGVTPDTQYCGTGGSYNITSSSLNQLTGFGVPVQYVNNTPSTQSFDTSVTVTATVSISLSTSTDVNVNAILGSVQANVTATATGQLSGSQSVHATMQVRPGTTGKLTGAIARTQTGGTYTRLYSNCDVAVSKYVTALTPYAYTYTASGG